MKQKQQGSLIDEHGDQVDPEWERFQDDLKRDGVASIPLLRSEAELRSEYIAAEARGISM